MAPHYYLYTPSKAAAIIFAILFVITTLLHTFQLIKKKTWYFIPFLLGGICKSQNTSIPLPLQPTNSQRFSWSSWFYLSRSLGEAVAKFHAYALPITNSLHSSGAKSLRCFNLYDTGKDHSFNRWRRTFPYSGQLDDKIVRVWRHSFVLDSRCR